jgi:hypothetical protein
MDLDDDFLLLVPNVEMRRIVVAEVHEHHDPVETTDRRHFMCAGVGLTVPPGSGG